MWNINPIPQATIDQMGQKWLLESKIHHTITCTALKTT